MESTSAAWSAAFVGAGRSYVPPRVMILALPRRHPGSGSGYANGLLVLDRNQLEDIDGLFPTNGEALIGLIVAHEIAHHVQWLNRRDVRGIRPSTLRELQADCAAGWWLASANERHHRVDGRPLLAMADLERDFPRLIGAMNALAGRVGVRGMPSESAGHGTIDQRVRSMLHGLSVDDVRRCGTTVAP